jgi:hypothetical protein
MIITLETSRLCASRTQVQAAHPVVVRHDASERVRAAIVDVGRVPQDRFHE